MIKITDITRHTTNLMRPGDIELCLKTADVFGKENINVLVHDAYRISLIKINSKGDLIVKIGGQITTTTFEDLFNRFVLVYNTRIDNNYHQTDLFDVDDIYGYLGTDNSFIVCIPEQLLVIATQLGYDRESFINDVVYPHVSIIKERLDKSVDIKELYTSSVRDVFYAIRVASSPRESYAFTNMVSTSIIKGAVLDQLAVYCSAYNNTALIKGKMILDDRNVKLIEATTKAYMDYSTRGVKTGLKSLYIMISNTIEDYGLATFVALNNLEKELKEFGFRPFDNATLSTIMRSKALCESNYIAATSKFKGYSESVERLSEDALGIPSQMGGYTLDTPADPVVNVGSTIRPSLIEPTYDKVLATDITDSVDLVDTVKDEDKLFEMDNNALQQVHFKMFNDRFNDYKTVTAFETPEEKKAMVQKLLELIDDIGSVKGRLTVNNKYLAYPAAAPEVGIYDVLIKNAEDHIDFLNSIKFYGTDEAISELNVDKYIEEQNEGFSEARHLFGKDSNGKGMFYRIAKKLFSYDLKDVDGNIIRNSWDPKTAENLTRKEAKKYDKIFSKRIMSPRDLDGWMYDSLLFRPVSYAIENLDKFYMAPFNMLRKLGDAIAAKAEGYDDKVVVEDVEAFAEDMADIVKHYAPDSFFIASGEGKFTAKYTRYKSDHMDRPIEKGLGNYVDDVIFRGGKMTKKVTEKTVDRVKTIGHVTGKVVENVARTGSIAGGVYLGGRLLRRHDDLAQEAKRRNKEIQRELDEYVNEDDYEASEEYAEGYIPYNGGDIYVASGEANSTLMIMKDLILDAISKIPVSFKLIWDNKSFTLSLILIEMLTGFILYPLTVLLWSALLIRKYRKPEVLGQYQRFSRILRENSDSILRKNADLARQARVTAERGRVILSSRQINKLLKFADAVDPNIAIQKMGNLKAVKGDYKPTSKRDHDDYDGDDYYKQKGHGEAAGLQSINRLGVKEQTKITTAKDITNMSMMIYNTSKKLLNNKDIIITEIRYGNGSDGKYYGVVMTTKGPLLFELNNAFTPVPREIANSVSKIEADNRVIRINAYSTPAQDIDLVVRQKSMKAPDTKKMEVDEARAKLQNGASPEVAQQATKTLGDNIMSELKGNNNGDKKK